MKQAPLLALVASSAIAIASAAMAAPSPSADLAGMLGLKSGMIEMGDFTSQDGSVSYKQAHAIAGGLELQDVSFLYKGSHVTSQDLKVSNGYLEFTNMVIDGQDKGLGKISVGNLRSMGAQAFEIFASFDTSSCKLDTPGLADLQMTQMSAQNVTMTAPKDPLPRSFALPGASNPEAASIAKIETSWRIGGGDMPCLDMPSAELSDLSLVDATGNTLKAASFSWSASIAPKGDRDVSNVLSLAGVIASSPEGDMLWKLDSGRATIHAAPDLAKMVVDAKSADALLGALGPDYLATTRAGASLVVSGLNVPNPFARPDLPEVAPRITGDFSINAQLSGPALSLRSQTNLAGIAEAEAQASFTINTDTEAQATSQAFSRMAPGGGYIGALSINGAKASYIDQGLKSILEGVKGERIQKMIDKLHARIAAKAPPQVADAIANWAKKAFTDPQGARVTIAPDQPVRMAAIAMSAMMNPASLVDTLKIDTK